jgi:hypothetical protein
MPSISEVGSVVPASVSDRKGVGEPPGEPAPPSSGQLLADDRRRSQGAARNSQRRDRRQSRVVPITQSPVVAATRRPSSGLARKSRLVVAELRLRRARGHDQAVVWDACPVPDSVEHELVRRQVDIGDLAHEGRACCPVCGARRGSVVRFPLLRARRWPPGRAVAGIGGDWYGPRSSRPPVSRLGVDVS